MSGATEPAAPESPSAAAYRIVFGAMSAWWQCGALRALSEVGGLTELSGGPLSVGELAARCGVDPEMLTRVLRSVASLGLLRTVSPRTYELTEAGKAMMASPAVIGGLRFNSDPEIWGAIGELPSALRAGEPPFVARHGSAYDYMSTRPELAAAFYDLMTGAFGPLADAVASTIDFAAMGTVVDVGGGHGDFITAILRAHPSVRGILADLEHALPEARSQLAASGLADRCQVVACDFFTDPLPAGAGAYLLSHVIHNFSDAQATAVLRAVRTAMPDDGRVLLVELVLPDDDAPHWAKDLDIRMMSFQPGGGERTRPEYADLLAGAGFRLESVTGISDGQCVITGVPAGPRLPGGRSQ